MTLREGTLVLGRRPTGAMGLALSEDPLLSRVHASLHWRGGVLTLVDNDSRNGTEVEGVAVERRTLVDGDLIRLGDSFLLVRVGEGLETPPMEELFGEAPAMVALRRTLALAAPTRARVVLQGESGSGKGQSARALHRLSGRPGRFVSVNCAAIPEHLAESVLFGHKAGAFTGARHSEPGLFRAAEGGTLFIDEIGDMPPSLQPKLLHALEEGAVLPVGHTVPVPVDVRVVAATSVDLWAAVQGGRFRGDLWARLAELVVQVPALRERREDVLPLLFRAAAPHKPTLHPELVAHLLLRPWPFNVRELLNVATELSIRGAGREWTLQMVSQWSDLPEPTQAPSSEKETLQAQLRAHRGVITEVAKAMGCSRRHLYRLLERHGLEAAAFRGGRS